jgi:hypothetical protein
MLARLGRAGAQPRAAGELLVRRERAEVVAELSGALTISAFRWLIAFVRGSARVSVYPTGSSGGVVTIAA